MAGRKKRAKAFRVSTAGTSARAARSFHLRTGQARYRIVRESDFIS
jgi:hypothetical protein